MLSVLSDSQKAIVEAMTMRLHTKESLQYLQAHGHTMSERAYYRNKKKIENMKLERMHYIAKYFPDQHLERIDRCELIEKLCWENYHAEKDPMKKVKILESIVNIQPYLSGYYEATKMVLESTVTVGKQKEEPTDYVPAIDDGWDAVESMSEPVAAPTKIRLKSVVSKHENTKTTLSPQGQHEPEPESTNIPKDTIDVDLLGYDQKPFDVSDTWVKCHCNKWFKNVETRQKHAAKYHV